MSRTVPCDTQSPNTPAFRRMTPATKSSNLRSHPFPFLSRPMSNIQSLIWPSLKIHLWLKTSCPDQNSRFQQARPPRATICSLTTPLCCDCLSERIPGPSRRGVRYEYVSRRRNRSWPNGERHWNSFLHKPITLTPSWMRKPQFISWNRPTMKTLITKLTKRV